MPWTDPETRAFGAKLRSSEDWNRNVTNAKYLKGQAGPVAFEDGNSPGRTQIHT